MEHATTNIVPSQPQSPEQNGSNNNSNGETHFSADLSTNHVDDEGVLFDEDKTIIDADAPAVSCDADPPNECAPSQPPIPKILQDPVYPVEGVDHHSCLDAFHAEIQMRNEEKTQLPT
jgi:hypothetical protein